MEPILKINLHSKTPKYLQIVKSITDAIREGKLLKGDHIFSINELSNESFLSRDTVQKAYSVLRQQGVIVAVRGKGYYINRVDITTPYRILLLFNKISNYKKQIYNSFIETMGDKAVVDLKIHHYNSKLFESYIINHLEEYDYFLIMPYFYENIDDIYNIIKKIPSEKVIILDKDLPFTYSKYASVYQDFKNDIYEALESGMALLKKYKKLILVHPKMIPHVHPQIISHPPEIKIGFRDFCMDQHFEYTILDEINSETRINRKEVYIVIEETDLVALIKGCQKNGLKIGKEVGIISYNETPLKEILLDGITVISTDHPLMGETAARLILDNRKEKIKNPFKLIKRKSL